MRIQKILSGGPFLKSSTYFTEGRTDLTTEAIGPGFSSGVRTSISKETNSQFCG